MVMRNPIFSCYVQYDTRVEGGKRKVHHDRIRVARKSGNRDAILLVIDHYETAVDVAGKNIVQPPFGRHAE